MTSLSEVQVQFVRSVEEAHGFDITPLLDQVATCVANEVHAQLRNEDPWRLMVHTISHFAAGHVVGYGRPLRSGLRREVALAAVLFEVQEDLDRRQGVWRRARRVTDAFDQALQVYNDEYPELRRWVDENEQAVREFRAGGAPLNRIYLARLRLLRSLLSEVARTAHTVGVVGELPEVAAFQARTRGRPPLDALIAAEAYLLLCGFKPREIVELVVVRDRGKAIPRADAVKRFHSRHAKRRQRANASTH